MSRQQRRPGLTVLEVLVIAFVGVILLGLLVVGVRSWRLQAARLECAHHLKLIGESIHRYNQDKGHPYLPAERIADGYATWAVQIAPYLPLKEPTPLARWDLQIPFARQSDEVRTAQVYLYYCPARRLPPQVSVSGDLPGALGDYASSGGDGAAAHPWGTEKADGAMVLAEVLEKEGDRVLRWKSLTDLESLPRGQSYTVLAGEKHVALGNFGQAAVGDASLYDGGSLASCSRIGGRGHGLAQSPEAPFNDNFGSYHPGVCQFLMADAHVQTLTNDVSEDVLGRLLNRLAGK